MEECMALFKGCTMENLRGSVVENGSRNIPFISKPVLHCLGDAEISVAQTAEETFDPQSDLYH